MAEEPQEIIDILNKMIGLGSSIGGIMDNRAKWENATKMADYTQFLKNESKNKANAFQIQKENSVRDLSLSINQVEKNVHETRLFGASREKLHNLVTEKFQSDEIKDVMDNHNLVLNDNLTVSIKNVGNAMQSLDTIAKQTEMNRLVASITGKLNREFEGVADDMAEAQIQNLGTGQGAIANIVDAIDVEAYITQNPNIFKESKFDLGLVPEGEQGKVPFLPGDEESIYADVARQPIRTKDGLSYGGWDKKEYDTSFKARAKASTEEGSDIAQAIRGNMDNEAFIQGTDGENLETPYMRSYFGGDITELRGDAKKFDDPEARDDYNDLTTNGFIEFFKGQENVNENIKHMIGIADEQNDMDVKKAVVANILGYLQGTDFDASTGTMTPAVGMTNSPVHGFNIDARDVQTISFGTLSSPGYTDGNMFEYQRGSGLFGGGRQLGADLNSGTKRTVSNDKLLANKFDTWATINSTDTEALKRGYKKLNAILANKKKDVKKEEIDEALNSFNIQTFFQSQRPY